MFLMKCYQMLQIARNTAFTVSELKRESQQRVKLPITPPRLGLKPELDKLDIDKLAKLGVNKLATVPVDLKN